MIRHEKGSVLMVAALALPVLVGAAGLATDTIQWTLWKRQLQRSADSAALAGAFAKAQSKDATASASADLTRTNGIALSAPATIENAPTSGAYAGNNMAVRVVLRTQRALPFSGLFLRTAPTIRAEATASSVSNGVYCVIALENTAATGITVQGNASVNMGCGMATNAMGSSAVSAGGSSNILATPVAAVGGIPPSKSYVSPTKLLPYSTAQQDPYKALPDPTPLPSPCHHVSIGPNSTSPPLVGGCYSGMDIRGTVTLNPGIYFVDGGSFSVGAQANIVGTDVTIILTSSTAATNPSSIATIGINGGASINLTAPTSGPYANVLFYQDRRALDSGTNKINGNSGSKYQGAIYMPSQEVQFNGTSGMTTNCVQIVSRRVTFTGNTSVANICPDNPNGHGIPGTRVVLVG